MKYVQRKVLRKSDIGSVARYMVAQGMPIEVMIMVDRSLVTAGEKGGLSKKLEPYGEFIDNRPESRLISLGVPNVETADRLESAYNNGDLEGITVMEVDRMTVAPRSYAL